MKRLATILFFLLPLICSGQHGLYKSTYNAVASFSLSGPQTVIPSQEFFASGFQPGSGSPPISAGTPKVLLSGTFSNSFVFYNSGTTKWKFTIDTGTPTIIGTSGTPVDHGFAGSGTTQNVELYGADAAHPVIIRAGPNNGETGGKNGVQLLGTTTGATYKLFNVFVDGAQSSGFQINGDGAGKYYDSVIVTNCKAVNVGQEGVYNGATHIAPAYAPITYCSYTDYIAVNTGRENGQWERTFNCQVNGFTGLRGGQNDVAGQDNGFQWQDNGPLSCFRNFLYDSVKGPPFNIFGNGTIRNGRIRYFASNTGGQATYGFVGDQAGSIFGNTARTTLDTLFVIDVDFEYLGAGNVAELFQWAEKTIPMKLVNCRKTANILSWYTDVRGGGPTSTITFVNCTNFTPPPAPKYKSYDRYDHTNYYRLISREDYVRGRGAFTPHGF